MFSRPFLIKNINLVTSDACGWQHRPNDFTRMYRLAGLKCLGKLLDFQTYFLWGSFSVFSDFVCDTVLSVSTDYTSLPRNSACMSVRRHANQAQHSACCSSLRGQLYFPLISHQQFQDLIRSEHFSSRIRCKLQLLKKKLQLCQKSDSLFSVQFCTSRRQRTSVWAGNMISSICQRRPNVPPLSMMK